MAKKNPKIAIPNTAAAEPATDNVFVYADKKYKVNRAKVFIPADGLGHMTAADIAASVEAQKYLVENNCVGTIIEEVIE